MLSPLKESRAHIDCVRATGSVTGCERPGENKTSRSAGWILNRSPGLCAISELAPPRAASTMRAAIERAICFHTVPDDSALAMGASWRHGVNSTLKTVKDVTVTG